MKKKIIYIIGLMCVVVGISAFAEEKPEEVLDILQKGKTVSGKEGSVTLSISPGTFNLNGKTGERISAKLTIYNNSTMDITANVEAMHVYVDENGERKMGDGPVDKKRPKGSLASLIEISPSKFNLVTGAYRDVTISLVIPKDMEGTKYTYITASGEPVEEVKKNNKLDSVTVSSRVGLSPQLLSQLTLTVQDTAKYSFSMTEKDIAIVLPTKEKPFVNVQAKIKNTGNAEFDVVLTSIIVDAKGKLVARLKSNRNYIIRPGVSYTMECKPSAQPLPKGKYKAVVTLSSKNKNVKLMNFEKSFEVKK